MKMTDSLSGLFIYTAGDTLAAYLLDEFSISRLLGMAILSSTLYSLEIPAYFKWIDTKYPNTQQFFSDKLKRAALVVIFFNPLWIARHLSFIYLFTGNWQAINLSLLNISLLSFLINMPLSFCCNYLMQNHLALKWRYSVSSLYAAILTVYYAMSEQLFEMLI